MTMTRLIALSPVSEKSIQGIFYFIAPILSIMFIIILGIFVFSFVLKKYKIISTKIVKIIGVALIITFTSTLLSQYIVRKRLNDYKKSYNSSEAEFNKNFYNNLYDQ